MTDVKPAVVVHAEMVKECGVEHPRLRGCLCTKEAGHQGAHGKRKLDPRGVLWEEFHSLAPKVKQVEVK